jgi:hypothetical protein
MFAQNPQYLNPNDYPKFIKGELMESKEIALSQYKLDPGFFHRHYLRLITIYSSIVLLGLTVMILGSAHLFPTI